ncbi:class I SAM-dependent methyltransferase [Cryobacterium aureum]|uniref:class I SAM-dependent methyltransferase n=1 Tax=Cryobacterium aureum TaxID=995037 RepID=UPI000CF4611F|nr:class I SAM-dependent methyltransferase [Cryobacterium aureum]
MTHSFGKGYWEEHWRQPEVSQMSAPNPHLLRETNGLTLGTALDAGCGAGAEAVWLAAQGWQVTGADISANALAQAAERAAQASVSDRVTWVEADLTTWQPDGSFDLVVTNYAHPTIPQLAFYERISRWVAPGGTLVIVGHLHDPFGHSEHPAEATVTLADITAGLGPAEWGVDSAEQLDRTVTGHALRDVVVRATRRH